MSSKLRLVILGMMGRCPFGGQTWLYLNWVRAFSRLGHEVWYVEDDSVWPYNPVENSVTDNCCYAVRHIENCMARIGQAGRWAFRLADRQDACWGLGGAQLDELYRTCDILLNIVGATDLRDVHLKARRRVYVETDPVTAELRLANGDQHTRQAFALHDQIVTYGENYGTADCGVPLNGIGYGKTRQPVDLDLWPMSFDASARHFTTIGNYRQNGNDVIHNGQTYRWSKHHEWEKFIQLPGRTAQTFELAMMPDCESDRAHLRGHGWQLVPPLQMSLDIFGAYPAYFRNSRGEFTVAKDQNVRLRSGWFSERDACYLASGKPVVTQDTGFTRVLPVGSGLFASTTMQQAVDAIDAINSDYAHHCHAARELAESYFSAPKVGAALLKEVGA
jgi:hypothetical protein